MTKQLVILAGGKGTRLKECLGDLPKPMIPVAGKPLLEHQIELAARHGFTEILIFVCYGASVIRAQLGDGSRWGLRIRYVIEKEPLGTAGAVLAGYAELLPTFMVIYGDVMLNVDLERVWQHQLRSRADATLLVHPNDHPHDSDLLETDEQGRITAFHHRPHPQDKWFQNLVNAGLYVIEKSALQPWAEKPVKMDFGENLFPALLHRGANLQAYNSPEYIKDIGTPHRYARISAEYETGIVQRGSLSTPQRAVFLDRDGTLIHEKDCMRSAEELELLAGAGKSISELNHHGWRTVVVTNQPVIAKGWCSEAELQRMHNKLETLLGQEHAFLDRIYFCPHHPDGGFEGERKELKVHCNCRKPGIGMIQRAIAELNIDVKQSWLIGDTTTDLQTAKNAGLKSILVRTGHGGRDAKHSARPDHSCDSIAEAVDFIIRQNSESSTL